MSTTSKTSGRLIDRISSPASTTVDDWPTRAAFGPQPVVDDAGKGDAPVRTVQRGEQIQEALSFIGHTFVAYAGLIGLILSLLGGLDPIINLAGWAKIVVSWWRSTTGEYWLGLMTWFGQFIDWSPPKTVIAILREPANISISLFLVAFRAKLHDDDRAPLTRYSHALYAALLLTLMSVPATVDCYVLIQSLLRADMTPLAISVIRCSSVFAIILYLVILNVFIVWYLEDSTPIYVRSLLRVVLAVTVIIGLSTSEPVLQMIRKTVQL